MIRELIDLVDWRWEKLVSWSEEKFYECSHNIVKSD